MHPSIAWTMSIMFTALCCIPAPARPTETAGPTDQQDPGYDVRIVRDLARFDLAAVDRPDGNGWAVLQVAPDGCAYAEHADRAMTEDGRAFAIPAAGPVDRVLRGGTIKVIAILSGEPGGLSRFEEVLTPQVNAPDPGVSERLYSPFSGAGGGALVCRVNNGYPGIDRFRPAILIPRKWAGDVGFALKFHRSHAADFDPACLTDARPRLEDLLRHPKPLIAAAAARVLGAVGGSDPALLLALQRTRDPALKALIARVLLAGGPPTDIQERVDAIARLIDSAQSPDDLRPLAVGTLAAVVDLRQSQSWDVGRPVLGAITRRCATVGSPDGYDARLAKMIEATAAAHLSANAGGTNVPRR